MFLVSVFSLLLTVPTATAAPFVLTEAGITLTLPAQWEMTRWSDWDLNARHPAGMAMEQWTTSWQVPLSVDLGPDLAKLYTKQLEGQRAGDIAAAPTVLDTIGAIPVARTDLSFRIDRTGPKGVAYVATLAGDGKLIHVAVYAAASNSGRAAAALDALVSTMSIEKPAADLAGLGGTQKTSLGFSVPLPEGWRVPLASERNELLTAASVTAVQKPEACFAAAHPRVSAATVMLVCQEHWQMGILDESSFDGESALLKTLIYGKAADKVPPPEQITGKDRLGILFRPEINGHDMRMAVIPYDRGQAVAWMVGPTGSGAELDSVAKSVLGGLVYEGPDNGKSPATAGQRIVHTLTYRPFHPAVLVCVGLSLLVMGGLAVLVFRPRHRHQSY